VEGRARHAADLVRKDLHYAARVLGRSRVFTAVALLALALGIGATTAVFSVVNGVLLRPLPFERPEELVMVLNQRESGRSLVSYPDFVDWREGSRSFDALTLVHLAFPASVLGGSEAVVVPVSAVSTGFLRALGIKPWLGRAIAPEENRPGGPPVALVSYRFWRRYLGGTRQLEGLSLDLHGRAHDVVGVLPPGVDLIEDADVWYAAEQRATRSRSAQNYYVIGRLRPGVTLPQARQEMNELATRLRQAHPDENTAGAVNITPLREYLVGSARPPLLMLLAASALVLLVACANVASTFLARGAARRRELAMRAALGASRRRIVLQLFTESLLLAVLGGFLGMVLAQAAVSLVRGAGAGMLPRLEDVAVDGRALAFAVAIAMGTAILFGLLPALRSTRELGDALRAGSRGSSAELRVTGWRTFVAAEVAMAVLLLVGSGLLIRSLATILDLDTGYDRQGLATIEVSLPSSRYPDNAARLAYYGAAIAELESLPGVRQVGLSNHLPTEAGFRHYPILLPPVADPHDPAEWAASANWRVVNADYFEAMRIPLLRGRSFTDGDAEGAPGVAVINAPLAEELWPGEDPLGKRLRALWDRRSEVLTVIGVVAEARDWRQERGEQEEIYVHYRQRPENAGTMHAVLRIDGDPAGVLPAARRRLMALDAEVPARFSTMQSLVEETLSERRFTLYVLGGFAATAVLLALIGVYGVVSYSVARSTREIGIRMALGADARRVVTEIQREALRTVGWGLVVGLGAALVATRAIESLLFGVSPTDPLTFVAVMSLLLAAAALASYVPARRATRVDPIVTMRAE